MGIRITLKGLEYLNDNTFLKRVIRVKNGVQELAPSKYTENGVHVFPTIGQGKE
jgi:hypothetical protein